MRVSRFALGLFALPPMFLWPGLWITEEPPASSPPAVASAAPLLPLPAEAGPPVPPRDVGSMAMRVFGDGHWTAVTTDDPSGAPLMWKTRFHPDATRPDAEVFVAALDASRVRVSAVAGTREPEAVGPAASYVRKGTIPASDEPALLAAWNGGWKSEHGHHGMKVDGVTLAPPKDSACTIAGYDDDTLRIAPFRDLSATEPRMLFFRQSPACLYVKGVRHPGLAAPRTTSWGADADGNPVIRRSAMGLSAGGALLFVGVSNATTAPELADGMRHAGAVDVAELDINWAFPKLVVYHAADGGRPAAQSLFAGFPGAKDEFLGKSSQRDFFYVVRR